MPYIIITTCVFLTLLAGWLNNIIWLFHQDTFLNVMLGVVCATVAPLGVLHGLYLFF